MKHDLVKAYLAMSIGRFGAGRRRRRERHEWVRDQLLRARNEKERNKAIAYLGDKWLLKRRDGEKFSSGSKGKYLPKVTNEELSGVSESGGAHRENPAPAQAPGAPFLRRVG